MTERERLETAITALEAQREILVRRQRLIFPGL